MGVAESNTFFLAQTTTNFVQILKAHAERHFHQTRTYYRIWSHCYWPGL